MKKIIYFTFCFIALWTQAYSQGKFAPGQLARHIGDRYLDRKKILFLPGFELLSGTIVTDYGDPEPMALELYGKGKDRVLLFVYITDTSTSAAQVIDVMLIKNMDPHYIIAIGHCRDRDNSDISIIAMLKQGRTKYNTEVQQAWRCNRDKIRFESIKNIKGISCINSE